MAAGTTHSTAALFTCPGCEEQVSGTVSVEFTLDPSVLPDADGQVTATAKVTGLKVAHDCVPKVTRKHRATRTAEPVPAGEKG